MAKAQHENLKLTHLSKPKTLDALLRRSNVLKTDRPILVQDVDAELQTVAGRKVIQKPFR